GFVEVLFTPLLLTTTSVTNLGIVLTIAGFGGIVGALVIGIWGGPKRLTRGILLCQMAAGAIIAVGGTRASLPLWATCGFLYFGCVMMMSSCADTLWQKLVAPEIQGKVFSVLTMLGAVT